MQEMRCAGVYMSILLNFVYREGERGGEGESDRRKGV